MDSSEEDSSTSSTGDSRQVATVDLTTVPSTTVSWATVPSTTAPSSTVSWATVLPPRKKSVHWADCNSTSSNWSMAEAMSELPPSAQPTSDEKSTAVEKSAESLHGLTTSTESSEQQAYLRDVIVVSMIYYLMLTVSQALLVSGWLYMLQLDPSTPIAYAGYLAAAQRVGHGIGNATFAYTTFVSQKFRRVLLIGRAVATLGSFLYLSIEFFSIPLRRFVFLLVFFLNCFGEGSSSVIRSYIPRVAQLKDRQRAFAIMNGANMLAILTGPMTQIMSMGFSTEGIQIVSQNLRLSLYTAPIWICFLLNLIAVYISWLKFSDPKEALVGHIGNRTSFAEVGRTAVLQFRKLDKQLIIICFLEKAIASIGLSVMLAMISPYVVAVFNAPPEQTVKIVSFAGLACGIVAVAVVVLFLATRLGRQFKAYQLFPFALLCYFLMYFFSYPLFSVFTVPVVERNATTAPYGCNSAEYTWCGMHERIVSPYLWLSLMIIFLGMALPISCIAFDTIYSQVLGSIDQNLMQGAVSIVEDAVSAVAPIIGVATFRSIGTSLWALFSGVMFIGLASWLPAYQKLKPKKT